MFRILPNNAFVRRKKPPQKRFTKKKTKKFAESLQNNRKNCQIRSNFKFGILYPIYLPFLHPLTGISIRNLSQNSKFSHRSKRNLFAIPPSFVHFLIFYFPSNTASCLPSLIITYYITLSLLFGYYFQNSIPGCLINSTFCHPPSSFPVQYLFPPFNPPNITYYSLLLL